MMWIMLRLVCLTFLAASSIIAQDNSYEGRRGFTALGTPAHVQKVSRMLHCASLCLLNVCQTFTVQDGKDLICRIFTSSANQMSFSEDDNSRVFVQKSEAYLLLIINTGIEFREDGQFYFMPPLMKDFQGARDYCSSLSFPLGPWHLAMFKTNLQFFTIFKDYATRAGTWIVIDLMETPSGAIWGDGTRWEDSEVAASGIMHTSNAHPDFVVYSLGTPNSNLTDQMKSWTAYKFVCQADP